LTFRSRDAESLLSYLAASGEHKLGLIGGQAVNFWAEAFRKVEPALQADDLAGEARALLRLAALREEIPAARARAFAAAVLAESDVGRWALAMLRGEPHAALALVE